MPIVYSTITPVAYLCRGSLERVGPVDFGKYGRLVEMLKPGGYLNWNPNDPSDRIVLFTERIETLHFLEASYISQLQAGDISTYEIKRNTAEQREKPGLRVATMHRVKGLEFEHIVVVGANKGILPLDAAVDETADGVARRDAETGERSLLYVALTRARSSAAITGYGEFTPLVKVP